MQPLTLTLYRSACGIRLKRAITVGSSVPLWDSLASTASFVGSCRPRPTGPAVLAKVMDSQNLGIAYFFGSSSCAIEGNQQRSLLP